MVHCAKRCKWTVQIEARRQIVIYTFSAETDVLDNSPLCTTRADSFFKFDHGGKRGRTGRECVLYELDMMSKLGAEGQPILPQVAET